MAHRLEPYSALDGRARRKGALRDRIERPRNCGHEWDRTEAERGGARELTPRRTSSTQTMVAMVRTRAE